MDSGYCVQITARLPWWEHNYEQENTEIPENRILGLDV